MRMKSCVGCRPSRSMPLAARMPISARPQMKRCASFSSAQREDMRVRDHNAKRKRDSAQPQEIDIESLQSAAWRVSGPKEDYDPLMRRIGNADYVLLGE